MLRLLGAECGFPETCRLFLQKAEMGSEEPVAPQNPPSISLACLLPVPSSSFLTCFPENLPTAHSGSLPEGKTMAFTLSPGPNPGKAGRAPWTRCPGHSRVSLVWSLWPPSKPPAGGLPHSLGSGHAPASVPSTPPKAPLTWPKVEPSSCLELCCQLSHFDVGTCLAFPGKMAPWRDQI